MNLLDAIHLVEEAKDAKRFFGADPTQTYRTLAKFLHPDRVADNKLVDRATRAFEKLTQLYDKANGRTPLPDAKVIGNWVITEPFCSGDIADLHYAHLAKNPDEKVFFKIARSAKDNDLMKAEYDNLKFLSKQKGWDNYRKYLPNPKGTLEASGRRANVLQPGDVTDGKSLKELMTLFPSGIEFRHIVWMGNRALSALGFAHRYKIVHGAVVPEHLIFGPTSHGLQLVDWCYSVDMASGGHIKALVPPYKWLYPAEVGRKMAVTPATDIYMLMKALYMASSKVPRQFQSIFDHCMAGSPKSRPEDTWDLQERWIDTAKLEYGPARYVKLVLP